MRGGPAGARAPAPPSRVVECRRRRVRLRRRRRGPRWRRPLRRRTLRLRRRLARLRRRLARLRVVCRGCGVLLLPRRGVVARGGAAAGGGPSGGGTSSADRARPAGADLAVDRQAPARGRPAGGGRLAGGRAAAAAALARCWASRARSPSALARADVVGATARRCRRRVPSACGGRRVATGRRQDHSHQRAEQQADGGADELWTAAQASPRSGRSRACRRTRGCTCRCGPGPSSDGPSTACTCRAGQSA